MRRIVPTLVAATLSVVSCSVLADNLEQVYKQALISDPTYKKAHADWLTAKENLPLAMTGTGAPGSGLFPNLDANATFDFSLQILYGVSFHHTRLFLILIRADG